ncbi:MAG: HepT-like ribonuclease domain-containing protein [Cyanobacteriota bacterium]|nr:HepT-like ribonuclease domain-containing protein [Cyanobacteriota bacterium]
MSGDLLLVLTPLRQALERIERKAQPLLANPALLDREEGQDLLDVICMQFLAAGEALKRLEKLKPGLLTTTFPDIDWRGAMGFRDVIAHQYFDLDAEQVLLICQEALPGVLEAIRTLEASSKESP